MCVHIQHAHTEQRQWPRRGLVVLTISRMDFPAHLRAKHREQKLGVCTRSQHTLNIIHSFKRSSLVLFRSVDVDVAQRNVPASQFIPPNHSHMLLDNVMAIIIRKRVVQVSRKERWLAFGLGPISMAVVQTVLFIECRSTPRLACAYAVSALCTQIPTDRVRLLYMYNVRAHTLRGRTGPYRVIYSWRLCRAHKAYYYVHSCTVYRNFMLVHGECNLLCR